MAVNKNGKTKEEDNMKQTMKTIKMWAALLVAVVTLAACSSDAENEVISQPAEPTAPQAPTFTMTVSAQKGGDATRGTLTDNSTTISSAWEADDEVSVYNVTKTAALTGTLKAQSAGNSTTLSGELTGTVEKDDVLRLSYKSASYATQDGTLEGIAANCDFATATVNVTDVSGGNITTDAASFQSQQAIVKFTLKNSTGSDVLSASQLKVVADGTTYTVTPASATSTLYVALPGISSKNITLTATVGGDSYDFSKSGVTFVNGTFYRITVKMTRVAATGHALSASTLGEVVGTDGLAYAVSDKNNLPSGVTAAGMVAYKSGSNGLVIALTDEVSKMTWSTATGASGAAAHTPAVTGKTWRVANYSSTDASNEWKLMFKANGGSEWSCTGLNTAITAAGGNAFQQDSYWTGTAFGDTSAHRVVLSNFSNIGFNTTYKTDTYRVRAVFAF